jgi:drug/metabolite transporter (DMT)-like permease
MNQHPHKEAAMIGNRRARRILSLVLMALGGLLLFLAPEDFWIGTLLLCLGVALEAAGVLMQRRTGQ